MRDKKELEQPMKDVTNALIKICKREKGQPGNIAQMKKKDCAGHIIYMSIERKCIVQDNTKVLNLSRTYWIAIKDKS